VFLLFFVVVAVARGQTPPDVVVASVNGVPITQKQVDDSIAARIYPLQQQLYAIRKAALENLIVSRLLEVEAQARGVSVDELRRQLTQGEINVTRAQVEQAFAQNASFFAAMSADEARERLRLDLENQARMKHYRAALEQLRSKWTINLNLPAPVFAAELDEGMSPVRGAAKPAVTLVEFSDFECRFCRDVQATLKQVLESYGAEVRLVFKHLPLEGHRNAVPAARAAYCAGEQDRFWQFHDALFAADSLSPAVFDRVAADLGLGLTRFKACVSSEQSRAAVVRDLETARSLRIDSTPSFLINGKLLKGVVSFAEFQKIIQRELNQASSQN
jgi:predicted DsbA family dithiol-disulfide isomerase